MESRQFVLWASCVRERRVAEATTVGDADAVASLHSWSRGISLLSVDGLPVAMLLLLFVCKVGLCFVVFVKLESGQFVLVFCLLTVCGEKWWSAIKSLCTQI